MNTAAVRLAGPRFSVFIGVALAFIGVPSAFAIAVTDDAGRKVELAAPAKRIVTLAPFLTELAFSAGAGGKVVGVSEHSDYPREARALPQVAAAGTLAMEPLMALAPDLVLAWRDSIRPEDLERLARFGIPVYVAQARRLDDVPRLMEAIGALAGSAARSAAQAYRARIAALRAAHAGKRRVPVLVEVWHRPLTTIAGAHWINEALELCGAGNVFDDLPGVAPALSWEQVFQRDPAAIVGAGSAATRAEFEANWASRPTLAAVRARRLVFVEGDLIVRPTARLADGVQRLCEGLERARR